MEVVGEFIEDGAPLVGIDGERDTRSETDRMGLTFFSPPTCCVVSTILADIAHTNRVRACRNRRHEDLAVGDTNGVRSDGSRRTQHGGLAASAKCCVDRGRLRRDRDDDVRFEGIEQRINCVLMMSGNDGSRECE
jgi:hypothetical protein